MWDPATIVVNAAECAQLLPPADDWGRLVLYSGAQTGRSVPLQRGRLCIGRAPDAWLRLDDPGLSRLHAELQVGEQGAVLHDLGSANGSHVNGQALAAPTPLQHGDLLRLGTVMLKYLSGRSLDAALHDHVWRLAVVDMGTGVFNRRHLLEQLARELPLARHGQQPLSAVCYDLDHFKQVNDRHGHAAGDLVLSESAARVKQALDGQGVLCRQGGEEFAVLLPGLGLADAASLAERLRLAVAARPFRLPGAPASAPWLAQTVSVGVAQWAPGMDQGSDLLAAADAMLYQAKQGGRNRVCA